MIWTKSRFDAVRLYARMTGSSLFYDGKCLVAYAPDTGRSRWIRVSKRLIKGLTDADWEDEDEEPPVKSEHGRPFRKLRIGF